MTHSPSRREVIAWVIDPDAWAELDGKDGHMMGWATAKLHREKSLTKADAILSLIDTEQSVHVPSPALKGN